MSAALCRSDLTIRKLAVLRRELKSAELRHAAHPSRTTQLTLAALHQAIANELIASVDFSEGGDAIE